ncbi:tetratricopeptide repeat protein [Cellulophaga baltica]|uniref:tetratricopeptide repeat protein n=1 Tax=Cellulophaga baltica TaxID=76594 RepID=UPI002148CE30|nr:tetratricopeptide repeat protein [Cellulophaga baltica]MCR1026998.1 tetratricopeptide repeat protein [Cellulophaga baltica]
MKKFFKYLFIGLGSIILLIIFGVGIWWTTKTDEEKSNLMVDAHAYDAAIELNQDNSDAWMERSVLINKAGDFNRGFEYLDKAVELEPAKHLGYRGWIRLRKMRDYDKALIDFDRLDSLTPNVVDAPWGEDIDFLRGECHYGNKDYQNAIKAFNQSVINQEEDWADIHTFVYLGLCEYELGNLEKAISEFHRALKQSENICEAHFGLAKTYQKLGDFNLAKTHLDKAEKSFIYKRDDYYNEYLNEIYLSQIVDFKQIAEK